MAGSGFDSLTVEQVIFAINEINRFETFSTLITILPTPREECTNVNTNRITDFAAGSKLRMTIHRDVRAICQEATLLLGMEMQPHAMELIAELVWKKIQMYGTDLELFASHAKRSTIKLEDVKLLARRNPSLKAHISKLAEMNVNSAPKESKKKRMTIAAPSNSNIAQPSTSATNNNIVLPPKHMEPISSFMKSVVANEYDVNSIYEMDKNDDTIDLT